MLILVISCGTFIFSSILTAVTENLDGWGSVRRRSVNKGFLDDHIEYLINDK